MSRLRFADSVTDVTDPGRSVHRGAGGGRPSLPVPWAAMDADGQHVDLAGRQARFAWPASAVRAPDWLSGVWADDAAPLAPCFTTERGALRKFVDDKNPPAGEYLIKERGSSADWSSYRVS